MLVGDTGIEPVSTCCLNCSNLDRVAVLNTGEIALLACGFSSPYRPTHPRIK
jgi:hypothetical protein